MFKDFKTITDEANRLREISSKIPTMEIEELKNEMKDLAEVSSTDKELAHIVADEKDLAEVSYID